jgi:hypothetical protein
MGGGRMISNKKMSVFCMAREEGVMGGFHEGISFTSLWEPD